MRAERSKDRKLTVVGASGNQKSVLGSDEDAVIAQPATERGETCPVCFGTGMQIVQDGARRCDCQAKDQRQRLFEIARIPPRYQHCSIHNFFNVEHETSKYLALDWSRKFIEEYLETGREDGRGLLFIGPVGVGKTHLAAAILRELIQHYGVRGLFYQFGVLLKEIQNSYNPVSQTSELGVLQPVFDADVLVLDELGASKPTDWVRDTMMQIINTRYNDKRITIFTTNYRDERSNDKAETLEDRIGSALRSRLYEMCKPVVIEGEDYRKRLAKGSADSASA
jgi:DNA replication protein DnaC